MIKLTGVTKKFAGGGEALRGVDLQIQDGEFLAIVGASGCGKSTLLRVVAGLEAPSSGQVEAPAKLAMVFQSGALMPWETSLQNASFGLRMSGVKDAEKMGLEKLGEVGLSELAGRYPRELSGGQRQRVGIARALAVEPEGLLLDEPFSALDAVTTTSLHQDLLRIWQHGKMTVVLVSHSIEEAVLLADRVAVMKDGQILEVIVVGLERPRLGGDKLFAKVSQIEKLLS